jgi:cell division protease FtsH
MKVRELLLWIVLAVLAVFIWEFSSAPARGARDIAFSDFMARVDSGSITKITLADRLIVATTRANESLVTEAPPDFGSLIPGLIERRVKIDILSGSSSNLTIRAVSVYTSTILPWFTFVLVVIALGRVRALERKLEALGEGGTDRNGRNS